MNESCPFCSDLIIKLLLYFLQEPEETPPSSCFFAPVLPSPHGGYEAVLISPRASAHRILWGPTAISMGPLITADAGFPVLTLISAAWGILFHFDNLP